MNEHPLFDSHCHLAGSELFETASILTSEAQNSNVCGLAIISADIDSNERAPIIAQNLKQQYPAMTIVYTTGIHPHESAGFTSVQQSRIAELSLTANAIGETGLDFHYNHSSSNEQENAFRFHIKLAKEQSKGLIIHCRNSAHEILRILDEERIEEMKNPGVIHCFSETNDIAVEFIKRGFFISFSGMLTFKNAAELRGVATKVPLEKLLIETDSPWLAPIPKRGAQNQPSLLTHVFDVLCTLRSEPRSKVAQQLWKNSCTLFGIHERGTSQI